jgi:hypothetical protein
MVLFPELERPVNQSTAGGTGRLPMRILSHARSCSQKRPIFDTNSNPPTASDSTRRRVNRKTSVEVVTVPSTRHVTAFTIDLVCDSVYIDRSRYKWAARAGASRGLAPPRESHFVCEYSFAQVAHHGRKITP